MGERSDLGFVHRYVPAEDPSRTPLLLLHGTGADENDLIPLGLQISPGAALLSPRGKVLEQGMPRFFRRVGEGVFDVADLAARTQELADFVDNARAAYKLAPPIALGFSNGANIAWSLLFSRPQSLAGAILIRAMLPFEPDSVPHLDGKPVLMLSGIADPIISADQRDRLAKALKAAGAGLQYELLTAGHRLTHQDVALAAGWLARRQSEI
jgi:phospholipase/carboxylesterase